MKTPLLLLTALAAPLLSLHAATEVATLPSGYLNLTVAAGSGSGATPSVLAFPLQGIATAAGQMTGAITGFTSSTLTNAQAGWTPSQLSQASAPSLVRLISGAACGRTFLISTSSPNDSSTLTLDPADALGTDLTTLGIVAGDRYEILPADTLLELLGTPATTGVLGSAGVPSASDQALLLLPGGWTPFYYDTSAQHWLLSSALRTVSDNFVIRPDTGVIYNRYAASPLTLTLIGRVPAVTRQAAVLNSGPTALSTGWPTDLTLGSSSLQTLPGWTTGVDTVQVFNSATGWRQYLYDGTHWRLTAPPHAIGDSVVLSAGSLVIVNKAGAVAGQSVLTQAVPYPLTP